ncbi:MAG: DUF4412 domain-containing protein [Verrucomicrobia bacterium]|nr:DUF4412 domain-containing protein [Verrucomicrobiota bacterium]
MTKSLALALLLAGVAVTTRADLTIVQKIEAGGKPGQATIRIKGDKVRVDPAPQVSLITDTKTGDTVTLMHDQRKIMRMSGERMKAAAQMVSEFARDNAASPNPGEQHAGLTPLGRTEQVNGITTQLYSSETGAGKATYFIAPEYPDGSAILKEMQALQPTALANAAGAHMPDFRDLPGVPVKIEIDSHGRQTVITLVSIKRDPIPDAEFTVPADYTEIKVPAILGGRKAAEKELPDGAGQPAITPVPRPTP